MKNARIGSDMSQLSEYRQQFLPEIDHRMAVWVAYNNVLNAFQNPEMNTQTQNFPQAAVSTFQSNAKVTITRFRFCLGVLDGLVDKDKDDDFKKEAQYDSIVMIMEKEASHPQTVTPDFVWFRYWTALDKLLRRNQFYTTSKVPSGHL